MVLWRIGPISRWVGRSSSVGRFSIDIEIWERLLTCVTYPNFLADNDALDSSGRSNHSINAPGIMELGNLSYLHGVQVSMLGSECYIYASVCGMSVSSCVGL